MPERVPTRAKPQGKSFSLKNIVREKDEFLMVDAGLLMTYRVVMSKLDGYEDRKMHESSESLRYKSILEDMERTMQLESAQPTETEKLMEKNRLVSFSLIIFPDMFSTLQTLETAFSLLLDKYPHARLILVGFPGLPNTTWPEGWVLNSELHSRCAAQLFQFLLGQNLLYKHEGDPIFLMGIGTGVPTLARYVVEQLPELGAAQHYVRSLICVNGFLRCTSGFRRNCKQLKDLIMSNHAFELEQLIMQLHFQDDFLIREGRDRVMELFWSTRKGVADGFELSDTSYKGILELVNGVLAVDTTMNYDDPVRTSSRMTPSRKLSKKSSSPGPGGESSDRKFSLKSKRSTPNSRFAGVITSEVFDGVRMLTESNYPVVVVQSANDAFVDPRNQVTFSNNLSSSRSIVTEFENLLDSSGGVYVVQVPGGHEIIQERNSFILALVSNVAQLCGVNPYIAVKSSTNMNDDVFDVLQLAEERKERLAKEERDAEENRLLDLQKRKLAKKEKKMKHVLESGLDDDSFDISSTLDENTSDGVLNSDELKNAALATIVSAEEEAEAVAKREKQMMEKEKRTKLAAERRVREQLEARKAEMSALYEKEVAIAEAKREDNETLKMWKEDKRSKFAAEYLHSITIINKSAELAHEKAERLYQLKREDAIKKVEEEAAFERIIRMEDRRKKSEEIIQQLAKDELALTGEKEGGYGFVSGDIGSIISATQRLLKDFLECRQKCVEAMRRQNLVSLKVDLFRKQCNHIESEVSRLRRAIRLVEQNPSLVGGGRDKDSYESHIFSLRQNLVLKEESLMEFLSIKKNRELQLAAADRTVQSFKLKLVDREELMKNRMEFIGEEVERLSAVVRRMKLNRDDLVNNRNIARKKFHETEKKLIAVKKEYLKVKTHQGKLIDTDLWVEGVLQRAVTKDLKKHLKEKLRAEEARLEECEKELNERSHQLFSISDTIALSKRDCDKLSLSLKHFSLTFSEICAVSLANILTDVSSKQEMAVSAQDKRNKDKELAEKAKELGANSIADRVRLKEHELRTKDERKFIGADIVLHPEKYLHVSQTEAEEMQFDADYQCELTKTDLERIIKLPIQVNLALPFLHTLQEIDYHRVFNTYFRSICQDEEFFRKKDMYSCGGDNEIKENEEPFVAALGGKYDIARGKLVGPNDMQNAEAVHDILVKESLRNRLRCCGIEDNLSNMELAWLQLDRVLNPEIFGIDEVVESHLKRDDRKAKINVESIDLTTIDNEADVMKSRNANLELSTTSKLNVKDTEILVDEGISKKIVVESSGKRDGDKYETLRYQFCAGVPIFDSSWHCPFTAEELIEIRSRKFEELASEDEYRCRFLMEKYYVSEFESIIGSNSLRILQEVNENIQKSIQESEEVYKRTLRRESIGGMLMENGVRGRKGAAALLYAGDLMTKIKRKEKADNESVASLDSTESGMDNDEESIDEGDAKEREMLAMNRIWGSWEQIHPASSGVESQLKLFKPSNYNPLKDHPASYALPLEEHDVANENPAFDMPLVDKKKNRKASAEIDIATDGLKALTEVPGVSSKNFNAYYNSRRCPNFIVDSVLELSQQDHKTLKGKKVYISVKDTMTLLSLRDLQIESRQSRIHRFIIPDREDARVVELTISVVFQGVFGTKGYRVGRLAAALFRMPDENNLSAVPMPIGYSPYNLQAPNLPDSFGRVVIMHKPRIVPIAPGVMQVIIGSASTTRYSIEVTAKYAKAATQVIDELITKTREMQNRYPKCVVELDSLEESIRLAERKLYVCDLMINEAEEAAKKKREKMYQIMELLEKDDETMAMFEEERKEYVREHAILEIEHANCSNQFASRIKEKESIKEGINMMHTLTRQLLAEKKEMREQLEINRRDLPTCVALLNSVAEAVNVAASLNTNLHGVVGEAAGSTRPNDSSNNKVLTPAENVRARYRREGWDVLSLNEQQWTMLDQVLNPTKYEWLREEEEKANEKLVALGKKPKKFQEVNAAVEAFKLSKPEILHVMKTPFSMLTRHEGRVCKLLSTYHDDAELLSRSAGAGIHGFDPYLAERTRAKNASMYSKEEEEWTSIDKILHPEIWNYYVHDAENKKFLDKESEGSQLDRSGEVINILNTKTDKKRRAAINAATKVGPSKIQNVESSEAAIVPAPTSAPVEPPPKPVSAPLTLSPVKAPTQKRGFMGIMRILGITSAPVEESTEAILAKEKEKRAQEKAALKMKQNAIDMATLISITKQKMEEKAQMSVCWKCKFTQEQILKIWSTPKHKLSNDDEKICHTLLNKYNGSYSSYVRAKKEADERRENYKHKLGKHINWNVSSSDVTFDVDLRCRILQREIDRVAHSRSEFMDSAVLHANNQRFPTVLLRIQLEEELDAVLREQIFERERSEKLKYEAQRRGEKDDLTLSLGDDTDGVDGGVGPESGSISARGRAATEAKVNMRAKKREMRKKVNERVLARNVEKEVLQTRKLLIAKNESAKNLQATILENALGKGGCIACRSLKCKYQPCVDVETVNERLGVLDKEIARVRMDHENMVFISDVCLSAQQGGNRLFKRADLLEELMRESRELNLRVELNNVDKELHDSYASKEDYIEVHHLHGYTTTMWTINARKALEARQSRLVGISTANDVVDGILDYMLEGWYFGESVSINNMTGYVPSVKSSADGSRYIMKPGQDQIQSSGILTKRLAERAQAKKDNIILPIDQRGSQYEKSNSIEQQSQLELRKEKVAKKGSQYDHMLNETESTLRFGLFMLALMYFRAMVYVRREKVSWAGDQAENADSNKGVKLTVERQRMIEEERRAGARKKKIDLILARCKVGEQRRKEREAAEKREAAQKLQEMVLRVKLETKAVTLLQSVYRGHLGRKAAKRWALKRAELGAMHFLLSSTAICIQRMWRGYMGRMLAIRTRRQMAYFIALMRQQEAVDDEELYWQTHAFAKFKKDNKEWFNKKFGGAPTEMGGSRFRDESMPFDEEDSFY